MTKPRVSRYVESAIAVVVSLSGFWWIVSQLHLYHGGLGVERVGAFCMILSVTAAAAVSWGWFVSLLARSRDWEPQVCRIAALLILVPGVAIVARASYFQAVNLLLYLMCLSPLTAGRLAFPAKTDAELTEPSKPITLMSK
jgi:hypothetical protein